MRKMLDGLYGVTTTAHDDVLIKRSSDGYRLTYTARIKGDSFMQVTFQSNQYVSLLEPRTNANKSDMYMFDVDFSNVFIDVSSNTLELHS
jgi:hypothetical protein